MQTAENSRSKPKVSTLTKVLLADLIFTQIEMAMIRLLDNVITCTLTIVGGLWLMKSMEREKNIHDFQLLNPCTAATLKVLDCGSSTRSDGQSSALQNAAYLAARMRSPDEVIWSTGLL